MISNSEILNRFDVLYNNITSSQAPGLDGYEKSVFWNKAQLEVLKNHLTPGGNKYGTGFDQSSKRQVEFSNLVTVATYLFPVECTNTFNKDGWVPTTEEHSSIFDNVLSIINEQVEVVSGEAATSYITLVKMLTNPVEFSFDIDNDGEVTSADITPLVDSIITDNFPGNREVGFELTQTLIDALLNDLSVVDVIIDSKYTVESILQEYNIHGESKTVVPINHVEYDTLISRPYKYPPRSQAWRLINNDSVELIVGANACPIRYTVRYVRMPKEINLEDDTDIPEIPEMLIDEVLQRAVELAKAAYVSDATQQQLLQTLGERSE